MSFPTQFASENACRGRNTATITNAASLTVLGPELGLVMCVSRIDAGTSMGTEGVASELIQAMGFTALTTNAGVYGIEKVYAIVKHAFIRRRARTRCKLNLNFFDLS